MIKVGIVGGSGYGAIKLIRLLQTHPHAMIAHTYSHSKVDEPLKLTFPHLQHIMQHFEAFTADNSDCNVIFSAAPAFVSKTCIPPLVERGIHATDLSGAFRIKNREIYEVYYKETVAVQDDLSHAIHSISERQSLDNNGAKLISNPGCFPIATLLALHSFISEKIVDSPSIIIDARTGVSGAGRSSSQRVYLSETNENLGVYAIGNHKRKPEIEQYLSIIAGQDVSVVSIPYLVSMTRGILSTIHVKLSSEYTTESLHELMASYYANQLFVRIRDIGTFLTTKEVLGSNYCDIGIYVDETMQTTILVSVIDNPIKGASDQAIQNLNILYDSEVTTGLEQSPVYP